MLSAHPPSACATAVRVPSPPSLLYGRYRKGPAKRHRYRVAIEETIANAKGSRSLETVKAFDGATVYAYPQSQGRIAWSVNARENGLSILRGIRRPDGADEGVA